MPKTLCISHWIAQHVDLSSRPIDCGRRPGLHRDDGRRVRGLHLGRRCPPALAGGDMEQHLVPALIFCRNQLHKQLVLRAVCCHRFVDRGLPVIDLLAPIVDESAATSRTDGGLSDFEGLNRHGGTPLRSRNKID